MREPRRSDRQLADLLRSEVTWALKFASEGKPTYLTDEKTRRALDHSLEQIGEYASKTSPAFRRANPEVPWEDFIELRFGIAHVDASVDPELVWRLVETELPRLLHRSGRFMFPKEGTGSGE